MNIEINSQLVENMSNEVLEAILKERKAMEKRKEILKQYTIKQLPGGRWHCDVYINGKRNNITRRTRKLVEDYIINTYHSSNNLPTLVSIFDDFMIESRNSKANETCKDYEHYFNTYLKCSELGNKPIQDIKKNDFYIYLEHVRAIKGDLKLQYFKNVIGSVNAMIEFAEENEIINGLSFNYHKVKYNQDKFVAPAKKSDEVKTYSKSEKKATIVMAYEDFNNNHNTASLGIILTFYTGVRVGELIGLKWSDIDFKKKKVHIQRMVVKNDELKEHTKSSMGDRILSLNSASIKLLMEIKKNNFSKGFPVGNDDFVFLRMPNQKKNKGKIIRMTDRCFNQLLTKYCRNQGIVSKSMHDIRRTVITELYNSGLVSDRELQRIAGHSTLQQTLDYVKHQRNDINNDCMEVLAI